MSDDLSTLLTTLRQQYADLVSARATVVMGEALAGELDRLIDQVVVAGRMVRVHVEYRPGVSPYTGSGMNAKPRPDFVARGIKRR